MFHLALSSRSLKNDNTRETVTGLPPPTQVYILSETTMYLQKKKKMYIMTEAQFSVSWENRLCVMKKNSNRENYKGRKNRNNFSKNLKAVGTIKQNLQFIGENHRSLR